MDVACSLDSYIKQYQVTREVAMAAIDNLVEDAWKDTNRARFYSSGLLLVVNRIVRQSQSLNLMYRGNINLYTFTGGNKDMIMQLFVEPIPI